MFEQCLKCEHFRGSFEKGNPCCSAFPFGIPNEIWEGDFDHNGPFKGDKDVRFEPAVEEDE